MPSKNYTLFFVISVGFVLLSIAFITILGQAGNKNASPDDIRAKAGVASSVHVTGTVLSYDAAANTMSVANIQFSNASPDAKTMGTWTVTPRIQDFVPSNYVGKRVDISVDATTFDTGAKTLTAIAIQ